MGGVIINDVPTYRVDHMPYGGVKDSGIGREGLRWAIDDMTELLEAGLPDDLCELLEDHELEALRTRMRGLVREGRFPVDPTGRRYPWPLV